MRVVPSALAATTARTGYSSIMLGARSQGTSTPRSVPWRTTRSPTGSPPSHAAVLHGDIGAHLAQRGQQPGAQRIQPNPSIVSREPGTSSRGHQRKRGRGRIARHQHIGGAQFRLAVQA